MEIASSKLHDGNGWRQVYSTLDNATPSEADHAALIEEFQQAVRTSYGEGRSFENVPFIAAWLRMATGHADSLPTHYPRLSANPDPLGENFRWFTANESGPRTSLPDLDEDTGLPMFPDQH